MRWGLTNVSWHGATVFVDAAMDAGLDINTNVCVRVGERLDTNAMKSCAFRLTPTPRAYESYEVILHLSRKSKWGLNKWGLKVLVHNCPRLPTIVVILRRKFPLKKRPRSPQKCSIIDDCVHELQRVALSPHLDFPKSSLRKFYFIFLEVALKTPGTIHCKWPF